MIKVYGKLKTLGNVSIKYTESNVKIENEITSIYSSLIGPFVQNNNNITDEDSVILWSITNNYFFEL